MLSTPLFALRDLNGKEIHKGDRAVLIGKGHDDLEGRVGEVRDVTSSWGFGAGEPRVRVTEGPDGNPSWSAWCKPNEIVIV